MYKVRDVAHGPLICVVFLWIFSFVNERYPILKIKQINSVNASYIFYISKKNPTYKISSAEKIVISNSYFVKRCRRNYNVKIPGTLETLKVLKFIKIKLE